MENAELKTEKPDSPFIWRRILEFVYSTYPNVDGLPKGVAAATLATDCVEALFYLRECSHRPKPKEITDTWQLLIIRFNDVLFKLIDLLHREGASEVLHNLNGPTGVKYAADQNPAPSFSEAVCTVGRIFYAHCLCTIAPALGSRVINGEMLGPMLDPFECFANWEQIVNGLGDLIDPVPELRLAIKHEKRAIQQYEKANPSGKNGSPPSGTSEAKQVPFEDETLSRLKEPLTPLQRDILDSIWRRSNLVRFSTLRREVQKWKDKDPDDTSIERRLKDIKSRWSEAGILVFDLTISLSSTSVKLVRPNSKTSDKKSDNRLK